ncbi:MAG: M48 family metalloprotease [candidate division NC10 bacterium]|nr:M48 family metalloprotease [candidate division NC10 bacterium]
MVKKSPFLLSLFLVGLTAFLLAPPGMAQVIISESQEVSLGRQANEEILKRFGRYEDPKLEAYVASVGQRLVQSMEESRGFRYTFTILDTPEANAMALPGGYVYITRGMLAELNSGAQLAGVLGHELGHVTARHAAKQLTRALGYQILTLGIIAVSPGGREHTAEWGLLMSQIFQMLLLGYSRDFELEADTLGLRYAAKAGYDPGQMVSFLRQMKMKERLRGLGYHGFSTHPEFSERIVKAQTLADLLTTEEGSGEVDADTYKAHLEGLRYGEKGEYKRLKIYTAKGGESLPQVAQELLKDQSKAWDLALLNGLKEDAVLKAGEKVKVILD